MTSLFGWMSAHPGETLYLSLASALGMIILLALLNRVPISYNLLNIVVRWKTVLLSVVVFTVVIGLLVGMLAFVNGMYAMTENSGRPGNVIVLAEGATDEAFSSLQFGDIQELALHELILKEGDKPLASWETYLIIVQPLYELRSGKPLPGIAEGRPSKRFLQVRGVVDPEISAAVHGMKLFPGGEWFSEAGVRQLNPSDPSLVEVVIGWGIAGELGVDRSAELRRKAKDPNRLMAGDTFPVGDKTWYVAGVMEATNTAFDSEVWAKQSYIGPLFGKSTWTTLFVRTANAKDAEKLVHFYNDEFSKTKVSARTEAAYFKGMSETNSQFLAAIVVITAIMSLGGIFGVMNTMFAAISQRTKDIGVLRLLGYKRWQIMVSFLLESLLVALIGGLLGCAIGSLSHGWTANSIVASGPGGGGKFVVLKLAVDSLVLSTGLLMALLMGFLGGLVPSLSAMRLTALEALR